MNPSTRRTSKKLTRPALVLGLLLCVNLLSPQMIGQASAAPVCASENLTPEGQVMVVSDNIYEAKMPDAGNASDVNRFAKRVLQQTSSYDPDGLGQPDVPDVVLVQEVRKVAVTNLQKRLNALTGCSYKIVVNASRFAFKWANKKTRTKAIVKDTAILMNDNTMNYVKGGYVDMSYKAKFAAPGDYVFAKQAAWAVMVEQDLESPSLPTTLLDVAAASVHYPRKSNLKNTATDEALKRSLSKRVADKLQAALPDPDRAAPPRGDDKMHVIAGDMNSFRVKPGTAPKEESLPYRFITSAPYDFTDGPIEMAFNNMNPIDFLFSTGNFITAAVDKENETNHDENSPTFYSNHDLRWGVLEGLDVTAPTPPGFEWRKESPFSQWGLRWWLEGEAHMPARDAGTGLKEFLVERKVAGTTDDTYIEVGRVPADDVTDTFVDTSLDLVDQTSYVYRLKACDWAVLQNCSAPLTTTDQNGILYSN